nr:hypothetical protein 34 [bacterium]
MQNHKTSRVHDAQRGGIPALFEFNGKWFGADGQPVDADVAEWLQGCPSAEGATLSTTHPTCERQAA